MPYIGNTAGNRFVASQAATRLSGNGSTVAFTLEHAVGSDEDILVSVDGVIQEPSIAYAVSNGTTLTFTAAPSSGTNNIFVCYLFRTVATVDHPSTSALTATNGNFTGTLTVNDDVSIEGSTPTLSLADTDVSNNKVELNYDEFLTIDIDPNNARGNTGLIVKGDGTERMRLDSIGALTLPKQPAFLATPSSSQTNMATDSNVTVAFATEVFDQNDDFASNTFTAPVTGRYQLSFHVRITTMDKDANYTAVRLNTSNRNCDTIVDSNEFGSDVDYVSYSVSLLMDMDANDTASVVFYQGGGAAQVGTDSNHSFFSGYLVC